MTRFIPLFALLLASAWVSAQTVIGQITNEFAEPVPYANIYVEELATGTVSDDEGRYVLPFSLEGEYRLIFSSLGYAGRNEIVRVGVDTVVLNVELNTSGVDLMEITVQADKKDPAYGIIRRAIEYKNRMHLSRSESGTSYRTDIYVKAVEEVEKHATKKERRAEADPMAEELDPFAAEEAARQELLGGLNMVEMNVRLNYRYPRQYKEERTGYAVYGRKEGLFIPKFAETDFNFYRNLVPLPGIADAPVISPLSNTSVLTYKFKLLATDLEDGQNVYEIEVEPRKTGNSTVSGRIYINADDYSINRFDFAFPQGALRLFDRLSLRQSYVHLGDSLWVTKLQAFDYETKAGKKETFRGTTTLSYANYEPDYPFPAKFFGNEVAVTTREAYERDTAYWAGTRTVALESKEAEMVYLRDSIRALQSSAAYQDSIQELYNKVTLLELAFDGVGFRNNEKKSHLYFGPLSSMIDFNPVTGFEVGPYVSHTRRYENGRIWSKSGTTTVGLKNWNVTGNFSTWLRYDPFHLGDVSLSGGRSFESFNPNDAYLNQLKASNYYLLDAFRMGSRRELFNGFYLSHTTEIANRQAITKYETGTLINEVVDDEDAPVDFEGYQALTSTTAIFYTPGQRYMREPNRKVVLGSKWPTFGLLHRKGWNGGLGSDINFDYLQFSLEQDIAFGALGNSKYRAQLGQFVNTGDLRFVDLKRFRQSDPILYSDPLTTFQGLNEELSTTGLHFEFHHIHHFNGALINNVPLLKKTRLKAVAGGGLLWLADNAYRHQELFGGVERVFKIGARRRLRVGAYAVVADATDSKPETSFKVSFDLIDIWRKNWSF